RHRRAGWRAFGRGAEQLRRLPEREDHPPGPPGLRAAIREHRLHRRMVHGPQWGVCPLPPRVELDLRRWPLLPSGGGAVSDLPQIDPGAVIQRQAAKIAELTTQVASLELLCEALRDERDAARAEVASSE